MEPLRPTSYATRRVASPSPWVVPVIESRLAGRFTGWSPRSAEPHHGSEPEIGAPRVFSGLLRAQSGRRVAHVEIEVSPWSHHVTELGLRAVGHAARRVGTRPAYGEAASDLLDGLVCHLGREAMLDDPTSIQMRRAS